MSKFKIVSLVDKVFITASAFILIYAWINFFIRDLWTTFFLSLIFSFACLFVLFYFSNKHNNKKALNKNYLIDIEEKFLAFQTMQKNEQFLLLKKLFNAESNSRKLHDSLVLKRGDKNQQVMLAAESKILDQFTLLKLLSMREKNVEILTIICYESSPNLNVKILNNLKIEIVTKNELYNKFFITQNTFPDCSNLASKNERKKLREIAKNFFIPAKAKSFFWCGFVLIFSSIILPYHFYYLIFGSLFLICSMICKLRPYFSR